MRNVASKHLQNDDVEDLRIIETNKWGSMPILNLMDKEGYKNAEEIEPEVNEDEGLQEVSDAIISLLTCFLITFSLILLHFTFYFIYLDMVSNNSILRLLDKKSNEIN